ncbi:MAG: hypothetical protein ACFFDL_07640 [Promethearchaeota archaeon]
MILKKRNNKKKIYLSTIIVLAFTILGLSIYSTYQINHQNYIQDKILFSSDGGLLGQWFTESHQKQWIDNYDFNNTVGWISEYGGDVTDVDADISGGYANFHVIGDTHTTKLISGTPNSSSSQNWYNAINPDIPVYPTQGHKINKSGCFASHLWAEHNLATTNAYQKTSVHWEKVITTPYNMSDYIITNASLRVLINATAKAYEGIGGGDVWHWEGIEVAGDDFSDPSFTFFTEGDYIKFYVRLSNLDKSVNYKTIEYKTTNLGQDGSLTPDSYDYLNDTIFEADNVEDLIFYLNQVLETGDYQNFIIILGIEFNCEDNCSTDLDEFTEAYIKSCNLTISYVKRIDQLTSASWKYLGNQIDNKGGVVRVTNAKLFFNFKIDKNWITNLSPNSELRIVVNDLVHTETIKLSNAKTTFSSAKQNGFDITRLIPAYEEINISIQLFLADEFQLNENYTITIDNVFLNLSYDLFFEAQLNLLYQILLAVAIVASSLLSFYYIYYRRVLRFPKSIRKLRKFRKSLNKESPPDVQIVKRNRAFQEQYKDEVKTISRVLGAKQNVKSMDIKKDSKIKSKQLILILFILLGFFFFPLLVNAEPFNPKIKNQENYLVISQSSPSDQYTRETRVVDWIQNSQFNTDENWSQILHGDSSDLNADISNGYANYRVIGDSGSQEFYENGLSSGWVRIENDDGVALPDVIGGGGYGMDSRGWYAYYNWPDNQPQSVRVQWMKNFSMGINMSDYYITSASLKAWINGSAQATPVYDLALGGGIDRPGDTINGSTTVQIATGDFARYFVLISDPENNREFTSAEYQTDDLGKDGPPEITELNDTLIVPINEETLIFFLEQVLEYDHQNFSITLGIYIWCEDSGHPGDQDNWQSLIIKNFNLSISYEKKIDQFSSISWEYLGDQIEANGYRVEVTNAVFNFDYLINPLWPTSLSPNSEIKFSINDVEYSETIKLSRATIASQSASALGFDVTDLIPIDQGINVSIQAYLADEFILSDNITLSIDNVILLITYDVFIPVEESYLFQILFAIAVLAAAVLTTYIIYYQKVLKYPKPVRKVRKYRGSLNKEIPPSSPILERDKAFKNKYQVELKKTSRFLKGTPLNGKILREKILGKIDKQTLKLSNDKINMEKK